MVEEILEEIREIKRMQRFSMRVIVGSKEISTMMSTTPACLRVSLKRLQKEGYPISKHGSRIVAVRKELEAFLENRFSSL